MQVTDNTKEPRRTLTGTPLQREHAVSALHSFRDARIQVLGGVWSIRTGGVTVWTLEELAALVAGMTFVKAWEDKR